MLFSRNRTEPRYVLDEDHNDRDLIAMIDKARSDEDIRRVARMCMQRSRARIDAARAAAN